MRYCLARIDPPSHIAGNTLEHLIREPEGDIGVRQRALELSSGNDLAVIQLDARQCLKAVDGAIGHRHDRLIERHDALFIERLIDRADHRHPPRDRRAQAALEWHVATALDFLGVIQRKVGILAQQIGIDAVDAVDDAAHGDLRNDRIAAAFKGLLHGMRDLFDHGFEIVMVGAAVDDDRKFITADTARSVRRDMSEPVCDFLDQGIADNMAHRIVGNLEVVDVYDKHAEGRLIG